MFMPETPANATPSRSAWFCDLGRMPYREAFDLQYAIHAAQTRENGRVGEGILLVEHPPVITLGRRSAPGDLLVPREALERQGIEIAPTDRGGQMTWHGPGQIVAYPLISLQAARMGLHPYVRGLEQAVIETLAEFGVEAGRIQGLTGVWVGEEKICAIGLRISRWWSLHRVGLEQLPRPCARTDSSGSPAGSGSRRDSLEKPWA
jgi:lipoyl(octanoyl) transferase